MVGAEEIVEDDGQQIEEVATAAKKGNRRQLKVLIGRLAPMAEGRMDADVILSVVPHVGQALDACAFKQKDGPPPGGPVEKPPSQYQVSDAGPPLAGTGATHIHGISGYFWSVIVKVIASWHERKAADLQLLLAVLAHPQLLKWLVPHDKRRREFVEALARHLVTPSSTEIKLFTFSVLRNYLLLLQEPAHNQPRYIASKKEAEEIDEEEDAEELALRIADVTEEVIIILCRKLIAAVPVSRISSTEMNSSRFAVNSIVELISVVPDAAYRSGFVSLRQLGQSLLCTLFRKSDTKKQYRDKTNIDVKSFKFLFAVRIWAQAVGRIPELLPLVAPLDALLSAAAELDGFSQKWSVFSVQCLTILVELGESTGRYPMIGSSLLNVGQCLDIQQQRLARVGKARAKQRPDEWAEEAELKDPKEAVDPEAVVLKRTAGSLTLAQAEREQEEWARLVERFLSLLQKHPAFPEVSQQLRARLKKFRLQTRNAPMKVVLDDCLKTANTADEKGLRKRANLT